LLPVLARAEATVLSFHRRSIPDAAAPSGGAASIRVSVDNSRKAVDKSSLLWTTLGLLSPSGPVPGVDPAMSPGGWNPANKLPAVIHKTTGTS
jgi:hypothetical protein